MNTPDPDSRPFQVHLRGVVELLSRSIYSGPSVYLRELLQNAHDAIAARRDHDGQGGLITITPLSPRSEVLVVTDDGVGLNVDEVAELLATVGRSSKRDILDLPRGDRLGQFGIGLLSCFMIADEITVLTRSAKGAEPVEWVGRADGTFSVRPLEGIEALQVPVGTRVQLRPRADDAQMASEPTVLALARKYGEYLSVPIDVDRADGRQVRINKPAIFAKPLDAEPEELLALGEELVGARPVEAIALNVPSTGTVGVAFVVPYAPSPGARQATRAYLGRMLLSESLDDLLPEWGFFVRCIVTTSGLHPTASREALIEDSALEETRAALGQILRRWVLSMAATRPASLQEFLAVHHLGLRAVAVHDDELAELMVPHLRFETSVGTSTLRDLAAAHPRLRYTETVEEFRQLAPLASPDEPVVNGGYVYDAALLRRAAQVLPGLSLQRADLSEVLDALAEPPLEYRAQIAAFEERAEAVLAELDCAVMVRSFSPADVPAVYVTDQRVVGAARRREVAQDAGGLFGALLGKLDSTPAGPRGRLCLNFENRLVRTLMGTEDPAVFPSALRVVYVQSLLAGHHPLTRQDRKVLTDAMTDIVHLSVGLGSES
ncbi:HSP90 family protein [Galactobacter caseinivorans]|uniref:HSP90 family protein n=1 Tax=Galactobacter caseinivorans TaxID=2676123 RepID=A0A496PFR7_9MICC|nr:HSP90 family protein [Galactobacter caseinivorans]RKW69486.1 HSP90 family protein [Galactobacter caseinivorans]